MPDDTDPSRLERRLARERAARTEAEAVAERALRNLYLSNRNLDLLGKVADISNPVSYTHLTLPTNREV